MLKMRWSLLALSFLASVAWSAVPQKIEIGQENRHTKAEQRDNQNAPVCVKGDITAKQDKEKADKDAKDREIKAKADAELVEYTFWLAVFSGCMILVAAIQIGLFVWQLRLMKDAVKDGTKAANAAKESADATKAALAVERPWIIVEKIHLERREDKGSPIIPNYQWISFVIRNVGRSPAIIEECFVKIHDKKTISDTPDYSEPRIPLVCPATISVGADFETRKFGLPSQPGAPESEVIFYVIFGRIAYKELNGNIHHTGFSVEVSPHMAASTAHPNQAYDYYD